MNDEQSLIARAKQGDAAAFELLVEQHAVYVYNLALRVVKDPHEAEDMAQEAFLKAWRGLKGFRGDAQFSTWLYRIVANVCYNRMPKLKRELANLPIEEFVEEPPKEQLAVDMAYLSAELGASIHQAIAELPESYSLLISLRHLQGMNYNEIADVTGMPLGTVKTGIFRARKLLREALNVHQVEHLSD